MQKVNGANNNDREAKNLVIRTIQLCQRQMTGTLTSSEILQELSISKLRQMSEKIDIEHTQFRRQQRNN
jgi:hypothetical protein